jgi:predicted ferric reductase
LEGPYGQFDFADQQGASNAQSQVWIAGGIGITPFLAKLGERAANPPATVDTDLFYCTPRDGGFPERLDMLCQQAGVRLHRRLTDRDGPLDPTEIRACLKPGSSVWFCGPARWGRNLADKLIGQGLPKSAFHRETFEFR